MFRLRMAVYEPPQCTASGFERQPALPGHTNRAHQSAFFFNSSPLPCLLDDRRKSRCAGAESSFSLRGWERIKKNRTAVCTVDAMTPRPDAASTKKGQGCELLKSSTKSPRGGLPASLARRHGLNEVCGNKER
jgi:hypothetical protein